MHNEIKFTYFKIMQILGCYSRVVWVGLDGLPNEGPPQLAAKVDNGAAVPCSLLETLL